MIHLSYNSNTFPKGSIAYVKASIHNIVHNIFPNIGFFLMDVEVDETHGDMAIIVKTAVLPKDKWKNRLFDGDILSSVIRISGFTETGSSVSNSNPDLVVTNESEHGLIIYNKDIGLLLNDFEGNYKETLVKLQSYFTEIKNKLTRKQNGTFTISPRN